MQGREHLGVIAPIEKKGLLLNIVRYENELRKQSMLNSLAAFESKLILVRTVPTPAEYGHKSREPCHPQEAEMHAIWSSESASSSDQRLALQDILEPTPDRNRNLLANSDPFKS